ncbi:hypothetical protein A7P95_02565 [Eikenella longinqua]|uniref:Knr4/Smi1-like domain-containing protein n=2 Tax=Neisseriaceae TaxID=481 RepID=A0A1A9S1M4_9NEIS|nr:hypothetical protein A7P95_02565 [Eikenella longinqua]
MTSAELVNHYRTKLNSLPEAALIADIPDGARDIPHPLKQLLIQEHQNFLAICNGGSFGDIVLWSTAEILDRQYRVEERLKGAVYEIGQVLYAPIFADIRSGQINFEVDKPISCPFNEFIAHYIFGGKYPDIFSNAAEDDMWFAFLTNNQPKPPALKAT